MRRLVSRHKGIGRRASQGQAMVETALILPIIFLILAGTLDLSRAFFAQIQITNGAREGAAWMRANKTDFNGAETRIKNEFQSQGLAGAATVSRQDNANCATPANNNMCISIICYRGMDSTTTVGGGCANASAALDDTDPDVIEVKVVYTFKPLLSSIIGDVFFPVSIPLTTVARQPLSPGV
ncbi:MAG: pilus assembly protein [Chloroflexi bacterium]|nr:pilus assembly protein [Chloroflexota bacterium]